MTSILRSIKKHILLSSFIFIVIVAIAIGFGIRKKFVKDLILTDPIKRGSIVESVYGIGTVTATKSYQLKLGITSTIKKLYIKEGDHVEKGQSLVDLDGTGVLTAPFAGIITQLPVKIGETVFAQALILNLTDLVDRYIVVSLEQRAVLHVHQGQHAKISFDSMREKSFEGIVQSVYSSGNNFFVRIGVSHLPPEILPGMTGDIAIAISERKDVLLIPVAAIDVDKVYVKQERIRHKVVQITTGIVDGEFAELASGDIHEGDRLVIPQKGTL